MIARPLLWDNVIAPSYCESTVSTSTNTPPHKRYPWTSSHRSSWPSCPSSLSALGSSSSLSRESRWPPSAGCWDRYHRRPLILDPAWYRPIRHGERDPCLVRVLDEGSLYHPPGHHDRRDRRNHFDLRVHPPHRGRCVWFVLR